VGIIARPTRTFELYVRDTGARPDGLSWHFGRLSMALEIITQIKILEEVRVLSDSARAESISALHTLLTDCGLDDIGYVMYEKLLAWRKPKFVAENPELSQPTSVDAGASDWPQLPHQTSDLASFRAALEESPPHGDTTDAWPSVHRDPPQDPEPTS
jgi:hypothetical protein